MSRVHDMGGRFGDGPVSRDPDRPVFPEDWHGRALAVTLAAGSLGQWNLDMSRHARECLAPQDYARFSYYEKWLAGLADLLVARGVVSLDELKGGAVTRSDLATKALTPEIVPIVLAKGGPSLRETGQSPRFQPGDTVRTSKHARNPFVTGGHTRLPAYATGAVGAVVMCHGAHVLPDANAHGHGEQPEPLYAVRFAASELWAEPENPRDEVVLDLWDSYLEPD